MKHLAPGAVVGFLGVLSLTACEGLLTGPLPGYELPPQNTEVPEVEVYEEVGESLPVDPDVAVVAVDPYVADRCTPNTVRGGAHRSVQKLTKNELFESVRALFEPHKDYDVSILRVYKKYEYESFDQRLPLQVAMNEFPQDFSLSRGEDFEQVFGIEQIDAWGRVVHELANRWVKGNYSKSYVDDKCLDAATPEVACYGQFVERFGKRVYRRPLTTEEITSLATYATTAADKNEAIYRLFARLLMSPHFMYLIEQGDKLEGQHVRLTSHEVASRVAFALTGKPPDPELMEAADRGELQTLEQVRAHAHRLITSDLAISKLMGFFRDWFRWDEGANPNKAWANLRAIGQDSIYNSDGMRNMYQDEAETFVKYIIWQTGGDFEDLMTSRIAFPSSLKVAQVFGLAEPAEKGVPVPAPHHPGLLTRLALLSSPGSAPIPIRRSINVQTRVLCRTFDSPDFVIVAARQEGLEALSPLEHPNHEITSVLTSPAACHSCHRYINPVGFLFESYNPLGQWSDKQEVLLSIYDFEKHGKPFPGHKIHKVDYDIFTTFDLPGPQEFVVESGLPTVHESAEDLIEVIAQSEQARSCMASRFFRHLNRRVEKNADACSLQETKDVLTDGTVLDAMLTALVNEDLLWRMQ